MIASVWVGQSNIETADREMSMASHIRMPGRASGATGTRTLPLAVAPLVLMSAILCCSNPVAAQISFETPTGGGEGTVCVMPGAAAAIGTTAGGDACGDGSTIQANNLTFGPAGPGQTVLSGINGSIIAGGSLIANSSAIFQGTSIFNGQANLVGPVTFSGGASVLSGNITLGPTTLASNGNVTVGGSFSVAAGQAVDMGGNRVQNVGAPVAGTDATNKIYVDGLHNAQQTQINGIVVVNNEQNTRLTNIETVNTQQNTRLTALEAGFATQAEQIAAINQSIKGLSKRDRELADGIAISLALAQPVFQTGQRFAMRAGWGNFDGSNALGVTAAGLLTTFNNGNTIVLDVGFGGGTRQNVYAGRAGLTFGW